MKSPVWLRFARRAIARSPPARCSIFPVGGRPIERSATAATSTPDRHRTDVRGGGDVFLSRRYWKIPAALHGSSAGRVGPLLRCLRAGFYFSQSDYPAENDDNEAALPANRPIGTAAWIYRTQLFCPALPSA